MDVDPERGPRCHCGHYRSEHNREPYEWERIPGPACSGAYGTLAADADDNESVEIRCHCDAFYETSTQFEVRR